MELYNIFKYNINTVNFDKNILEKNKDNLASKKDLQYFFNAIELLNSQETNADDKNYFAQYDYLYPHLDDQLLSVKVANIKEFKEHKYNINIDSNINFEEEANKLCNKDFELAPHQLFIRNFLSSYTPYNGILMYHGLGTGKTCSAIGIAEETREYLKYNGINQRIIIVASPNVQENFKLQLFDERKLKLENRVWTIDNCAGNNFLKDINMLKQSVSKEKVINIVNNIINNYYLFLGYIEFANLITKKSNIQNISATITNKDKNILIRNKLQKFFGNRLIMIDEIHNIRESSENSNKLVAKQLYNLVKNVENMKLVLMSATPMYNDYKEIIFLTNILNMNDKRSIIEINDVFDTDGKFIVNTDGDEIGKELLKRKLNGYVSYVKGDNPFTFPYRILPTDYDNEKSILKMGYPINDINNNRIENKINYFDLFINNIGSYQEKIYKYIIHKTDFKNYDSYKYTLLQKPLEALNIVYPNAKLESILETEFDTINITADNLVGKNGLATIMSWDNKNPLKEIPMRGNYTFKDETMENIFLKDNIEKYSFKINSILNSIENSEGPIIIYSQFIDGGLIPMALALESCGYKRYGDKSLFKTPPVEQMKNSNYIMITGDKSLTPDSKSDLKAATDSNNINGDFVKVILISMAGSEGLDFKYIRQIHILEPWYNINRIEQILGRGVRTCSHKDLPFNKRNVKIYMHGTFLSDPTFEAADLLIYRKAEQKAKQIGNITRILKELSVDCNLNIELLKYTENYLKTIFKDGFDLILSNGEKITYLIGDKADSALCDYMETCNYKCNNKEEQEIEDIDDINNMKTYNQNFLEINNEKIIKKIKDLFLEKYFYTKFDILTYLNTDEHYSILAVNNALTELVTNENYFIYDKYGQLGKIINIDDLYIYQPSELNYNNSSLYTKTTPLNYNTDGLIFKVSDKIKEPIGKKKYTVVDKYSEPDVEPDIYTAREGNKNAIFTNIFDEYINIISGNQDYINTIKNNKDKIKLLAELIQLHLHKKNNYPIIDLVNETTGEEDIGVIIKRNFMKIIVIHIILDNLEFKAHKSLIEYIYNLDKEFLYSKDEEKEFFNIVNKYYNDNMVTNTKITGYVFPANIIKKEDQSEIIDEYNYVLYIFDKKRNLVPGQHMDYKDLDHVVTEKYNISVNNYGIIVGFIQHNDLNAMNILRMDYDFKIRGLKNPDNPLIYNNGTICTIQAKNKITDNFIKQFLDVEIYENLFKIPKLITATYCVVIEIYLRYYNLINRNDKFWFFNGNYAAINNFYKKTK